MIKQENKNWEIYFKKEAEKYSDLIIKIENESYKGTCDRLSKAIGKKINGIIFHYAVKLIRQ